MVIDVIDGDTIHVSVPLCSTRRADGDLSFHIYAEGGHVVVHLPIRLLGCNAAEHGTPAGDAATAHLKQLLPPGTVVTLSTLAADKYGTRWDADVTLPDGRDLVELLIREQWAAPWYGLGPKPQPPRPRTETP
jgi:endonuclease YncB( thermonuclease family)